MWLLQSLFHLAVACSRLRACAIEGKLDIHLEADARMRKLWCNAFNHGRSHACSNEEVSDV